MRSIKLALFTLSILLIANSLADAQNDVVNVETNLVTLNVAITDRAGNYIKGMSKENFTVLDNGVRQDIDSFSSELSPVSFGIVYDMHPTTDERTATVLAALGQFTKGLRSEDSFFVTVFNEKGSLTTEFVPTRQQIDAFLSERNRGTADSLYDAIFAASAKVRGSQNSKRILLVLTDGADNNSNHSLKELRAHLRTVNLPVYSVTFNSVDNRMYGYTDIYGGTPRRTLGVLDFSNLNRGAIAAISKSSGGESFEDSIRNQYYLAGLFDKVYDEVRNQYVLGFYPDSLDGTWHRLQVNVADQKSKQLRISNRKGYQSPKRG